MRINVRILVQASADRFDVIQGRVALAFDCAENHHVFQLCIVGRSAGARDRLHKRHASQYRIDARLFDLTIDRYGFADGIKEVDGDLRMPDICRAQTVLDQLLDFRRCSSSGLNRPGKRD